MPTLSSHLPGNSGNKLDLDFSNNAVKTFNSCDAQAPLCVLRGSASAHLALHPELWEQRASFTLSFRLSFVVAIHAVIVVMIFAVNIFRRIIKQ